MTATSLDEALGRRTLFVGDVGAGKTTETRRLLEEALSRGMRGVIVLDVSPNRHTAGGVGVGGALMPHGDAQVRLLRHESTAPRLTARSPAELLRLAEENRAGIERLLRELEAEPAEALFANDVSIYLQRGDAARMLEAFSGCPTVVANGYLGVLLRADRGTGVSRRERAEMRRLAAGFDRVICLDNAHPIPPVYGSNEVNE